MAMLKKTLLAAVACGAIALTGSAFAQYGSSNSAGTTTHVVKHVRIVHHAKFSGRSLAGLNMREHAITENLNRQQLDGSAAVSATVAGGRRASLDLSERQITTNLNLQQLGGATVALGQQQIIGPTAMLGIDAQERQITAQLNRDQMNQALAFNSGTTVVTDEG